MSTPPLGSDSPTVKSDSCAKDGGSSNHFPAHCHAWWTAFSRFGRSRPFSRGKERHGMARHSRKKNEKADAQRIWLMPRWSIFLQFNIAIESHHYQWEHSLSMTIFNSLYVKSPEGRTTVVQFKGVMIQHIAWDIHLVQTGRRLCLEPLDQVV